MTKLKLITSNSIKAYDGREFTRLVGGFGENKSIFTVWQAAELLGLTSRERLHKTIKEIKKSLLTT